MESDIEYLISRLSKIDGFRDTGDSLLGIIKTKKPEKQPEPPASDDKPELPKPDDSKSEENSANGDNAGEATEKTTESN